ncbi:MAG: hypothetical protein JWO25_1955, partial [Alphaproteobacteria bacterium]|nr:hypothetical protein [Alphaproteobacteria bacterium]
ISFERDEGEMLLQALDSARARALEAAEAAQTRHDEDGRVDCCEEAGLLARAYARLRAELRG